MTPIPEHIRVAGYWRERKLTAREFIDACYAFLCRLGSVSESLSERCTVVDGDLVKLPSTLPSFEESMLKWMQDPNYVYTNPDSSVRSLTFDSTLPQGFTMSFSDCNPKATSENAFSILVRAGAHGHPNASGSAVIQVPPLHAAMIADARFARTSLQIMIDAWQPEFASVFSNELLSVLDPARKNPRPFGPLMYFAKIDPAALIGICGRVEPTSSGGTIVQIDAPLPWVQSAALFQSCFEALSRAGYLK